MAQSIDIYKFLELSKNAPILDVRSPIEFESGHIRSACNMPLFTNEERAAIGIIYKQKGKDLAMAKGYEYVEPKLSDFVKQAQKLAVDGKILVHCWRGGLRSSSMAELFEKAGLEAMLLTGGYKVFRQHVLESFSHNYDFRVIGGETGSGKTEILNCLRKKGEQVLDFEEIANHRGSSFGALGQLPQPTTEQFENIIFDQLQKFDSSKRIWVEDESQSIGRVFIPKSLFQLKVNATCYRLQIPLEIRVNRLVKDYGHFPKEFLLAAVLRIQKRLGGLATQQAIEALENNNLAEIVRITLFYYDKAYDYPQNQRNYKGVIFIPCEDGDNEKNTNLILEIAKNNFEIL